MRLGIDATIRYGLDVPATESLHESQLQDPTPYNTRLHAGSAADADRESRARVDRGGGAPGEGRLPLLRAQAGQGASLLHGELPRVPELRQRPWLLARRRGSSRSSAIPSRTRSRRACRTRRSRRAASTGRTSRSTCRRSDSTRRFAGSLRSGFAGANVTAPHKLGRRRVVRRGGRRVRQHARCFATARDRGRAPMRQCSTGSGRAARRRRRRRRGRGVQRTRCRRRGRVLASRRLASRRAAAPTSSSTRRRCATRCWCELAQGQTLVDLPYPESATARAARAAGATVYDGLDVLVAQGAASFELWTGVSAPVDVMRNAVRSAP